MPKEHHSHTLTPKGLEYQMELTEKEIKRLRGKLTDQISLFKDLLKTKEVEVAKKELKKGKQILSDFKTAVTRYVNICKQEKSIDVTAVTRMMEDQEESFLKVKKAVYEWIEALNATKGDSGSVCSSLNRMSKAAIPKEDTDDMRVDKGGKTNMRITLDLVRIQLKLESQISLFDDLLISKDEGMIKREFKRLIDILDQMKSIAETHGKILTYEDEDKIRTILTESEAKVMKMRERVNRTLFIIQNQDRDQSSHTSQKSRLSNKSKGTKQHTLSRRCFSMIGGYGDRKDYLETNQNNLSFKPPAEKKNLQTSDTYINQVTEGFEPCIISFNKQNSLVRQLLSTTNCEMMNKEIKKLDDVYDQLSSRANTITKIVTTKQSEEISDRVHEVDMTMIETKKMVATWMTEQAEMDRRSKKSYRSLRSRDSGTSYRSKKSKDNEGGHTIEFLKKQLHRNRERLEDQRGVVEELLLKKDRGMMNNEIDMMERFYESTVEAISKVAEKVCQEEANVLLNAILSEDNKHMDLKKRVIQWMVQQEETDDMSVTSVSSRLTRWSDMEKEGDKNWVLDNLPHCDSKSKLHDVSDQTGKELEAQMLKIRSKLNNQKNLVEELLNSTENTMMDREVLALDKAYDDFLAAASNLRDVSTESEGRKVSSMIDAEDASVFQLKLTVSKWMSKKSHKEEIVVKATPDDHGKNKSENILHPDNEVVSKDLVRLNEMMIQTLRIQSAPKVEIDTFSGDPLEYDYFMENFKDVVENLIEDPRQRLVRLLNFTEGEAKDLIKHCVHEKEKCYSVALELLEKEYGSSFKVACAYMDKLKNWPQIKMNDAAGIRELYRFLLRCLTVHKRGAIDLDSPLTIRTIQQSLPNNLQDKWTARVGRIRKMSKVEASFRNFVEFVEEESLVLNDPVYSRGMQGKKVEEKFKSCLTDINEKPVTKLVCPLCKADHDLDDCEKFIEKGPRAKKDVLFKLKLCFSCYKVGHGVKTCKNKRTCKTCGKEHPTALHEVVFKVSAVRKCNGIGGMCIVLVRMSHESCPSKEIEVYAMLDECSQGTFVNEKIVEHLSQDVKRSTTITVSTVNNDVTSESFAINGLIVRSAKKFNEKHPTEHIKLPITYTKPKLPMSEEDIPKVEEISKWDYLQEVVQTLSHVKGAPLGLLIGNNCKQAIEPIQVIPSQAGGPYAKRTKLGWCVVGSTEVSDTSNHLSCNNVRVCTPLRDITGSPSDKHLVLQSKITDNAIGDALREMWSSDFVERDSEKKALSKEDVRFLKLMKDEIKFEDGHYEVPLPLRFSSGPVTHSEDMSKESDEIEIVSPNTDERNGRTSKGKKLVVMPDNRSMVLQRLKYLKKKMLKDDEFRKEYTKFMKKLFDMGYARKVARSYMEERSWWIPHHGVYHPVKKKLRPVFDCSAKVDDISLNSKLIQGPDPSKSLLGVLARFRKGKIAFMADIETMYYQVRLPEHHSKFLRFFWWEDGDISKEPDECEMRVHPFGAISSKSCVIFALHQTALDNEKEYGTEALETLLRDFYVDDLLKSLDGENKIIQLVKNIDGMCAAGGFNLTKFVCANKNVMDSIPKEKRAELQTTKSIGGGPPCESALGVQYQLSTDMLGFKVNFDADNGTRRGCLSTIHKVYDPLGIGAPFLLRGRKFLQKLSVGSVDWYEKLDAAVRKEWLDWRKDLMLLNDLKFRRCYRSDSFGKVVSVTLHCFSDASFVGYGVACYLRYVDAERNVEVALVMGKSRVSPLKPTTVPRLELTASTVSVKIAALLISELEIEGLETFYWVDNKIVLGYIFNHTRQYKIFVANRVQVIESYTGGKNWNYVDTKDNPADYASRGISPREKEKVDIWLHGPVFLRNKDESWRNSSPEVEELADDKEVKTQVVHAVRVAESMRSILQIMEERISSWHRMIRVVAWVVRFVALCRKKSKDCVNTEHGKVGNGHVPSLVTTEMQNAEMIMMCRKNSKDLVDTGHDKVGNGHVPSLVVTEMQDAETIILRWLQERSFESDRIVISAKKSRGLDKKNGQLWRLSPFLDEKGILRVGGRLLHAEESADFRFPVIIPKGTVCTKRLVQWYHKKIEHRGRHSTVAQLREAGYWVISCGKEAGAVVHACVRCKWLRGKFVEQMMANLPIDRTVTEAPFTFCGVDLFGPMKVKEGRITLKTYGVLFTCLSVRAVHVEMASSLETDTFIQALTRFMGRRGEVREIRCDNGTNFIGAENELRAAIKEMDHEKIRAYMTENGGDWVLWNKNTPSASHMGGVWERQIRTVKSVLMSLIKSSPRVLNKETLRTFLVEAESIVNSRPLTLENLSDPESKPLSPKQVLTMKSRIVSPPPGVFQEADVYCRKRWRISQHMANAFWSRWRKEYLQLLQERQKWTEEKRNLMVGDVVLLKEEGDARNKWPLGRVMEVHPSKDGLVRSVTLRVGGATFKRPVHKTVLLVAADGKAE